MDAESDEFKSCKINKLKKIILLSILLVHLFSCTKEVNIDIPGFKAELVVDGNIETGGHPLILLSKSANVYEESYVTTYIESFVSDAIVSVVVDGDTTLLEYLYLTEFPLSTQARFAEMLRVELEEVQILPVKVYSSKTLLGKAGKTYELLIDYNSKRYTAITTIPEPVPFQSLIWKAEENEPNYGLIKAKLADPPNQFDAYKYDSKRINTQPNGKPKDGTFRNGNGGGRIFRDRYFDGLTIDLTFRNPQKPKDSTIADEYKRYFKRGDSIVVKLSKLDKSTYDFFRLKREQQESNGNPFATPVNAKTNIKGGGLGIWAGFSPVYDTLFCTD